MTSPKTPSRRHTIDFKLRLCRDIRSGSIGRREAQRTYRLSDNLIHTWLGLYDANELQAQPALVQPNELHAPCEAKIAALERKVGQLTMALERRRVPRTPPSASTSPTPSVTETAPELSLPTNRSEEQPPG